MRKLRNIWQAVREYILSLRKVYRVTYKYRKNSKKNAVIYVTAFTEHGARLKVRFAANILSIVKLQPGVQNACK